MEGYFFGDILIINFSFTNGTGFKRRPVMVIKDTLDGDIVVAKITSKSYNTPFDCEINDWPFCKSFKQVYNKSTQNSNNSY